ncbi:helix-turn-helix transcriptional regulator [Bacillus sp. MUM 13]|uniref:helix-turn-helix domain-containing protein n=1 Tax=Bacillus sp. MUM 13 TaxID=1678001 RepID=UPI0008F5D15E|nr:helix-turn-helix transcriptional regulator [Bacillus sp. MUM 13]OIK10082.1 hypothetical protein BIV59_15220 [Bacillus sp. MUM 13]
MSLPSKLKELRQSKNWNQDYVANKLNISRSAVSKYETGRQAPTVDVLMRYADLFGVSQNLLLSELTGIGKENGTSYYAKTGDSELLILQKLFASNPKLKKILLEMDQQPFKNQQQITEFLEIMIKGMKKR